MENTKYLQLGIDGVAENKEFNDALGLPTPTIKRVKLAKFIRLECNVNKVTFARTIDVSPAAVTKWLYTDTVPSIRVVKKIATVYGKSIEYVDGLFEEGQ